MSGPDVSALNMNSLSAVDIVEKLRIAGGGAGGDRLKNEGSIRIGSETFKVAYVPSEGGAEKLQMKRHYTGVFGWLRNWINRNNLATQSNAVALTGKVNEMMKSTDYKLVRNTYDRLMDIAKANKGDKYGVIEVGNYGHSEPRDKIMGLSVVDAVNRSLRGTGKSIRLNKIDTYNTFLGITNMNLLPDKYGKLMEKIASGDLKPDEKLMNNENNENYTVETEDLESWRSFITKPEIVAKIDIPKKLHAYLNQAPGNDDGAGLVGWKKDFKMNPDAALRHFVIKNITGSSMKSGPVDEATIDKMCEKLREYVDAYNEPDPVKKNEKMKEFFNPAKWDRTPEDETTINKMFDRLINEKAKKLNMPLQSVRKKHGESIKKDLTEKHPTAILEKTGSYILFANILMYATFRQTSKIGLDFFKSQNKPVLFHMSHRDLTDFGDTGWILNENHWKDGRLDDTYGGSEITHSEVRHANKLVNQYGEGTDGANLWYVRGA